jgi:hypothetical protein
MKYKCTIQKVEFFGDEVEDKGLVDLESAVIEFQNFPFAEQLEELESQEMHSVLPSVSFAGEDYKTLTIWAKDDKGFFLHYYNGFQKSDIYLSNSVEQNPEGLSPEDFIEYFYLGTMEEHVRMEESNVETEGDDIVNTAEGEPLEPAQDNSIDEEESETVITSESDSANDGENLVTFHLLIKTN